MKNLIAVVVLLSVGSAHAAPIVMDFEGIVSPTGQLIPANPYTEDGFQIDAEVLFDPNTNGVFGSQNTFANNSNGSSIYGWCSDGAFCEPVTSIQLSSVDNNPFALISFDASNLHLDQSLYSLSIVGQYAAGGTTNTILEIRLNIWDTFIFDSSWQGLSSVTISTGSPGGVDAAIDNIVVSAIPVPAAVWLFGSGLAGLGLMRRRKKV